MSSRNFGLYIGLRSESRYIISSGTTRYTTAARVAAPMETLTPSLSQRERESEADTVSSGER